MKFRLFTLTTSYSICYSITQEHLIVRVITFFQTIMKEGDNMSKKNCLIFILLIIIILLIVVILSK